MTKKTFKRVSLRYAKSQFTTVGLVLIVYILLVSYLPRSLVMLFQSGASSQFQISYIEVVGIAYACVIVGTILPFAILKSAFKIKLKDIWRRSDFRVVDILIYGVVIIALGSAAVFVMSMINTYIPLGEDAYIGIMMDVTSYERTPLFAVLFCLALPIIEEVALRGVLLRALGVYGNRFATLTSAFLYAALQSSFGAMIPAFLLAIFLTNMTLRFRSVTPAIIIHIVFNTFIYGFQFIPVRALSYAMVAIFVFYILAILFILSRNYVYVRIKRRADHRYVLSLFFTRVTVILAIILSVGYIVLSNILP